MAEEKSPMYTGKPSKSVKQPGWHGLIEDAGDPQIDKGDRRKEIGENKRPINKDINWKY